MQDFFILLPRDMVLHGFAILNAQYSAGFIQGFVCREMMGGTWILPESAACREVHDNAAGLGAAQDAHGSSFCDRMKCRGVARLNPVIQGCLPPACMNKQGIHEQRFQLLIEHFAAF